ncbi:hypothetical protein LSAT2_010732 [Lamellibrachia satsuma]|nr:hypothetical protein LSAT2_010732 [Lamellibrachia satsuma]
MIRKEDGTVKLLVYRKKMHTDQYLNFNYVSPSVTPETRGHHNVTGCNSIISEPEDREKEVEHITKSLERCGYPSWTIKKVNEQQSQKEKTKKRKKEHKEIRRYGHTPICHRTRTRLEEHKEFENITTRRFTREQKRVLTVIEDTSAITDHADRNNCMIDWKWQQ